MIIVLMLPLFFLLVLIGVGFAFAGSYPEVPSRLMANGWRKARRRAKKLSLKRNGNAALILLLTAGILSPEKSEAVQIEPRSARSCVIYQIRQGTSGVMEPGPFVIGCDGAKIEDARLIPGQSLKHLLIGKMGFRKSLECTEHKVPSLQWTACYECPV